MTSSRHPRESGDPVTNSPPPYVPGHGLLKGKSVLITAAAGAGIGFATAKRCLEEGAKALVMADIHEKRLHEATDKLRAEFPDCKLDARLANVTVEAEVQNLIDHAEGWTGGVDVLVNNAGLGGSKRLVDMSDEEWLKVIDVSLNGTFRMMRAMLKKMIPRRRGVIVNNASVLGWRAQKEQAHYAAAKAGVMALTRCAALEAAEAGVRINAVAPSIAMHEHLKKTASEALLQELTGREAFGRGAEVWEIANVIVFLASEYSSYLTGEVISASSQRA